MSYLLDLIEKRKKQNRDLKIIITARNSETGTGKTTLAAYLSKVIDPDWTAQKAAFSVKKYIDLYHSIPSGSAILLDEGEQAADNRRGMSNNNVGLSHAWAMLRYKQIFTIVTLPSVTMLDKRLKELADIRINVVRRGLADVKKIVIDDSDGSVREVSMERIRWGSLDGDVEYEELNRMKDEYADQYFKKHGPVADKEKVKLEKLVEELKATIIDREKTIKEKDQALKKAPADAIRKREAELMPRLKDFGLTHDQIAEVFGIAHGTVSSRIRLARDMQAGGHVTDALVV